MESLPYDEIYLDNLAVIRLFSASMSDAEYMVRDGMISEKAFCWYCLFWHLSEWRFSSSRQAKVYNKIGKDRFLRRMARLQAIRKRIRILLETNQIKGL